MKNLIVQIFINKKGWEEEHRLDAQSDEVLRLSHILVKHYAKINNIEYKNADILDLDNYKEKFDVIECSGVLHHMEDPLLGWEVLTKCLKKGGLMAIGLYSELARKHIVEMRKEIKNLGFSANVEGIKSFRNIVKSSNKPNHKKILARADFYSTSELRDLLFHVQVFWISLI